MATTYRHETTPAAGRRWRPAVPSLIGAAVTVAVTVVVAGRSGAPFPVDLRIQALLDSGSGWREPLAAGLTLLGGGPLLYPILLGLCAASAAAQRQAREFLPLLMLVAGQVLELLVFATLHRPDPAGEEALLTQKSYSSGHTAAAVLGWGLIVWQATRLRRGTASNGWPLWFVASVAGIAVGWTRLQLNLHWASDVVIGLTAGVALLGAALLLLTAALPPAPPIRTGKTAGRFARSFTSLLRPSTPPEPPMAGGRAARLWWWLRYSPWAWTVPGAAAAIPIGSLLATPPPERMKDLLVYHGAGQWAGTGQDVYAFQTEYAMPFTYPPFGALILEPLSRMPLGLVQTLWTVATLAAVVALAATVLRPVSYRIGLPLTVAALLVSSPVRSHLRFGQVGVFLVLLVTMDLLRRGRNAGWARGWGVGLATAVKLTPAVFLPWLLLTRQWRRLTGTVVWLAAATVAGLVLLWPSAVPYLRAASTDTTRFGLNDIPGNQSVRGMLLRLVAEPTAGRLWLLSALLLTAIGLYQAWRCERSGNRLAAVGVLAALSVAVSPISWVHHLVWLVIPIAALAAAGRFRLVTGWFVLLVLSLPFLGDALGQSLPSVAPLVVNAQGLTAVAAVALLPALVRERPGTNPDRPARCQGSRPGTGPTDPSGEGPALPPGSGPAR